MKREPAGLYILRFIMGFALLAFIAMLYWSSVTIEQNVRDLKASVDSLQSDIFNVRIEIDRIRAPSPQKEPSFEKKSDPAPESPNLFAEDKFYSTTLPLMLGDDFSPSGNYRQATIGRPSNLNPFSQWSQVNEWKGLCQATLGTSHFGIYETLGPEAAYRMEERINEESGKPEFWLFLRDDLSWEPLRQAFFSGTVSLDPRFLIQHPLTAHDYKFWYDALMNPFNQEAGAVALRTYYGDVESVEAVDAHTLVVRWKTKNIDGKPRVRYAARQLTAGMQPLAGFVYKYFANGRKIVENDEDPDTYRTNSVWAQNFAVHWANNAIVSCGPWRFEGWNERRIKMVRNPGYFNPLQALMEERTTSFKANPDSAWQDFKVGHVDTVSLSPDQLIEWEDFLNSDLYARQKEQNLEAGRIDYLVRSYSYIGWNAAKPYFQAKEVRRALTMALNRKRIIETILSGMGVEITGPFFVGSPSYDQSIKPYPYDPVGARLLLEKEGWFDSDGDGILDKEIDGERIPFSFGITYYVKNSTTKAVCEYVAMALGEIGIDCRLNGVDLADLSAMFDDKSFDALLLGWALGTPPEDPRQLWHSKGAEEKGSSNAVGFANEEADEIIDALEYEYDKEKRIELYHRFHQIIHEEVPYTFLYTPRAAFLYRDYVENVFIPADRQDLIPGANVEQPQSTIFWLRPHA
jgi:peptide/nickel transport system substrate-binding protein